MNFLFVAVKDCLVIPRCTRWLDNAFCCIYTYTFSNNPVGAEENILSSNFGFDTPHTTRSVFSVALILKVDDKIRRNCSICLRVYLLDFNLGQKKFYVRNQNG